MTSLWGFLWGQPWGAATEWGEREDTRDETSDLVAIRPSDLDVTQTALARLRKQFSLTTTWPALANVIGTAFDEAERAVGRLDLRRYVSHADGVWLDDIGALVGLPRAAWSTDDDYRLAIIAEALSRVTAGTVDEIVDVAVRLSGGLAVIYRERYPANFEIAIPEIGQNRWDLILDVMADMPPAGVGAWLTTWSAAATAGWGYSGGDPDPVATWSYSGGGADDALSHWSYSAPIG